MQITCDPWISEWGNLTERTSVILTPIHNVRKGTWGTETSKYPEEEKETSISKGAASEMERGQTGMRAVRGSDRIIDLPRVAEWFWKDQSERVKAP